MCIGLDAVREGRGDAEEIVRHGFGKTSNTAVCFNWDNRLFGLISRSKIQKPRAASRMANQGMSKVKLWIAIRNLQSYDTDGFWPMNACAKLTLG